jgi:hypothetical protein
MAMKNLFGAIHNPNKYHVNVGDPYIPDVFSFRPIKNKIRLHICDALRPQYEGGPAYMPQWCWDYNSLIVSTDPVALDYTGWQIIEDQRNNAGMPSLEKIGRKPTYIATAADNTHRLGTDKPSEIEQIVITS